MSNCKLLPLVMAFLFANISRAKTNSLHVIDTFKITKTDSTKNKRFKIIGLPLLFYVPETKFGGGGAGLVTFKLKNDSINTRTSSVQFDVAYTQLKQTLVYMPFQLWIRNETYNVYGEIGYYKYNYFFWGIGDKQPSNLKELYDVKFPRLKINALKRIAPHIYTGIKYNYDNFQIIRLDTAGLLSKGDITGSKGGIVSSLGFVVKYDSRDNLFYPTKGYLAEFSFQVDDKIIGSSFSNNRIIFDGSAYFTNEIKHTVALNFYSVIGNGDIPFNQMALLGGAKKMRGFYEGRYRDKNLLMLQTEYRIPLFWRLGAVVFISTGNVSDKVSNFNVNQFKLAYGGGLRVLLDKKQKINIRFDIGWAEPKPNFYLTVTEAF